MNTQQPTDSLLSRQRLYARLRDHQFSLYEDYARKHGLQSKSLLILLWIYRHRQGISQETIVKHTYSTKQVVNATIKMFLKKDYVRITVSLADKRKKIITLTPTGHHFAASVIDPMDEAESKALTRLAPAKQAALLRLTQDFTFLLTDELTALQRERKDCHDRI